MVRWFKGSKARSGPVRPGEWQSVGKWDVGAIGYMFVRQTGDCWQARIVFEGEQQPLWSIAHSRRSAMQNLATVLHRMHDQAKLDNRGGLSW